MAPKILIVDDEADILTMLNVLFKTNGFDVTLCTDGNDAVDLLNGKERFDVMISDVRMVPINGIWLLSFVRDHCPQMPVIMVTAYYSKDVAVEALRMGALDYIAKPFETQKLLALVKKAIKPHPATV